MEMCYYSQALCSPALSSPPRQATEAVLKIPGKIITVCLGIQKLSKNYSSDKVASKARSDQGEAGNQTWMASCQRDKYLSSYLTNIACPSKISFILGNEQLQKPVKYFKIVLLVI